MATKKKKAKTPHESLGERLARLRKSQGMTQVELAERLDIGQSNVSDYERDVCRPNADMLVRIADALGFSADAILGLDHKRTSPPAVSRKYLKRMIAIEQLPKRDQDALLRTIDAFLQKGR